MAKINEYYDVGDRNKINVEQLVRMLEDIYKILAVAVNKKPDVYFRPTDGQASDSFLSNGDINVNETTNKIEMLTSRPSSSTVGWTQIS
jgi:D-hexose-6-phosphate mutarotase